MVDIRRIIINDKPVLDRPTQQTNNTHEIPVNNE